MAKYRRERINEEVSKVLAESVRDIKDPRVSSSFVSVMSCDVTGDLKYARVYFSVLGGDAADPESDTIKEIKKGLKSAEGFLRCRLAQTLNLRITPELTFEYDAAPARGARISMLLKQAGVDSLTDGESDGGDGTDDK